MDNKLIKRLRPLFIWEILIRETDKDHPISTNELIKRLQDKGAECERRALQADINALQESGYEIKRIVSKDYKYYIESRKFTDAEIAVLIDAVQSVTFLTEDATGKLFDKLAALGGGGNNKRNLFVDSTLQYTVHKTENSEVLDSAWAIEQAIIRKKKITFHYFQLDHKFAPQYKMNGDLKKEYIVSPMAKTINNGNYYMIAITNGHKEPSVYRIDRMSEVTISDTDIDVTIENEDVEKYKKQSFEMYGDTETLTVKIKAHKQLIGKLYDTFGKEQIRLTQLNNEPDYFTFTCEVRNSPMFKAWCCSYGNQLEILAPDKFVQELKDYTKALYAMYNEDQS